MTAQIGWLPMEKLDVRAGGGLYSGGTPRVWVSRIASRPQLEPPTVRVSARSLGQVVVRFARVALAALCAAVAVLGEARTAAAEPGHAAYVARALASVRALGPGGRDDLDRALYDAARRQCHADAAAPSAACLIDAGRAACARATDRASCEAAADVVATNLRGQTALVDEGTRIRLVRGSADYRAALAAELRRRYAVLAAELALAGPAAAGDEARAIDELCLHRDRALHACQAGDAACVPNLPWSRCVAALVWFVGGAP